MLLDGGLTFDAKNHTKGLQKNRNKDASSENMVNFQELYCSFFEIKK